MVLAHPHASDREQAHTDWRAVTAAVVFHVLLVAALVSSQSHRIHLPVIESTVFVSLRDAMPPQPRVEPRDATLLSTAAAPRAKPVRAKTAAASGNTRPSRQRDKLAAEGRKAAGAISEASIAATTSPASDIAGTGAADSQARTGASGYTGPRFRPPRVQRRFTPDYPLEAFLANQQGSVDVIVDVAADGRAVEGHVYQSSGSQALDAAAVAGALKYTFKPAQRNGDPTRAQAIVTIDWTIGPTEIRRFEAMGVANNAPSRVETMRKLDCIGSNARKMAHLCRDSEDHHRRR